jgi:hypothetical protein
MYSTASPLTKYMLEGETRKLPDSVSKVSAGPCSRLSNVVAAAGIAFGLGITGLGAYHIEHSISGATAREYEQTQGAQLSIEQIGSESAKEALAGASISIFGLSDIGVGVVFVKTLRRGNYSHRKPDNRGTT